MCRGLGVCCSRWSLWYKGAAAQFAVLIIHSDSELRTEISFKFPAKFNLLLILFFLNGLRKMNFCFRIWITGVSALRPSSPYSCLERNRLKEEDSNFRSNEGLKSWHWSKNHRTAQVGRDLDISSGPIFHMKMEPRWHIAPYPIAPWYHTLHSSSFGLFFFLNVCLV